jgi:hypothetical protein
MLNRSEFIKIITGLADMFNKQISEFMLDIYYEALKDYSVDQVQRAVLSCLKNYKYSTLPKPSDILEYLEGTKDDRALVAWIQAKEAVQKGGYYASVVFKDSIIAHCIKELGGWQDFCCAKIEDLPFIEKRFMDLYRLFEKREIKENIKLVGYTELLNGNKGFLDKIPEPIKIGFIEDETLAITQKK